MTLAQARWRGLYAITDAALCEPGGVAGAVAQALEGGAAMIQYRDKSTDQLRRRREAELLAELCRSFEVPFIVNDDVQLATHVAASGVHIGRDDGSLAAARRDLGPDAIIGVSCYHQLELAEQAQREGADYVAFGRFFHSSTKPGQPQADLALLRSAQTRLTVPVVAIGGINADNAAPLIAAGASMLACIHSVFGQSDVRGAAAAVTALFAH